MENEDQIDTEWVTAVRIKETAAELCEALAQHAPLLIRKGDLAALLGISRHSLQRVVNEGRLDSAEIRGEKPTWVTRDSVIRFIRQVHGI